MSEPSGPAPEPWAFNIAVQPTLLRDVGTVVRTPDGRTWGVVDNAVQNGCFVLVLGADDLDAYADRLKLLAAEVRRQSGPQLVVPRPNLNGVDLTGGQQ